MHDDLYHLIRACVLGTTAHLPPARVRSIVSFLASPEADPAAIPLIPLFLHAARGSKRIADAHPAALRQVEALHAALLAVDVCQRSWLERFVRDTLPPATPLVLLKAAAFSGSLYPPGTFRGAADVDLLVREEDFDLAVDLVGRQGPRIVHHRARPHSHRTYFEACFEIPGPRPVEVEVHRALTQPHLFSTDHAGLFARSVPHPAFRRDNVRILSPEDTLLHLAVHAVRHGQFEPKALVDAALVLARWHPDLPAAHARARAWGASRALRALLEPAALFPPAHSPLPVPAPLRKLAALFLLTDSPAQPAHLAADYLVRRALDLLSGVPRIRL